jgi:PAT family beta-lactamase induction signal transducer AmpG
MAFASATQDIAIDAYSIGILDDREMGMANGIRVSTYRVALIVAGGVLVASAGAIGWENTFLLCGGLMVVCAMYSRSLPVLRGQASEIGVRDILEPLVDLIRRPRFPLVALFILLYKLGDMAMGPMVRPFWVDRGLTTAEIGFVTGTGGILASIAGALTGGAFTSRFGIFHGLWFMGIWQAVSNLGYAIVAMRPETGHVGVYGASMLESFCGGLGTAPYLAFLMSICRKDWAGTQYALLTALFGLARSLSGAASGWFASGLGYGGYFSATFFLAVPAFLLFPVVRRWIAGARDRELRPAGPEGDDPR